MSFLSISSPQEGIELVTFNRPESLNSLNQELLTEISQYLTRTAADPGIRGVIFTGAGKAFVAGADIREIAALNPETAAAFAQRGQAIFAQIENFPKPVIAAINGFALGGGCELAMACHLRIAVTGAKFGQPEVNLGIIPGYGGTQRLPQLVGRGKALEWLLTGDFISAEEARNTGLVNHLVENSEELVPYCVALMHRIISRSPIALRNLLASVQAGIESAAKGYEEEARSFGDCTRSQDFAEGTAAFLEKRKPKFTGS